MLGHLSHLAVLRIRGRDSTAFLQGQLSADLQDIGPARARLTSINSPQGRVQAVAWIVAAGDEVLLVVPAELADRITERLRRYVLRAKVAIDDASRDWTCFAAEDVDLAALPAAPAMPSASAGAIVACGQCLVLRVAAPEGRYLVLGPPLLAGGQPLADATDAWRLLEIRAGHPQVYAATWETFVAQMLNLDLLDAISFTKGCYTGQEIIARAHYRGSVKRRMVRLSAAAPAPPPGARVLAGDAHAGEVVDAVVTDERAELLAVVSLAKLDDLLAFEDGRRLERLTLPYAL